MFMYVHIHKWVGLVPACMVPACVVSYVTPRPLRSALKMASLPESVEYNTLIGCTTKLTTAFKSSPISVANHLLSNGFISPEVHDKVTGITSGLGDDVKAATSLVKCVTDQVRTCPGRYYDFMALSLFKEPWLCSLHDIITAEYGKKFILPPGRLINHCASFFYSNLNLFRSIEESGIGS